MRKSYDQRARGRVMLGVNCDCCGKPVSIYKKIYCIDCATGKEKKVVEEYINQQVEKRMKE